MLPTTDLAIISGEGAGYKVGGTAVHDGSSGPFGTKHFADSLFNAAVRPIERVVEAHQVAIVVGAMPANSSMVNAGSVGSGRRMPPAR